MESYLKVLKSYAVFSGRARRREYWMFALVSVLVVIALVFVDVAGHLRLGDAGLLSGLYLLAIIVPSIAVVVRRLHDTDRSGWWALISLVPMIGVFLLAALLATSGTPGTNRFGPSPKLAESPPYPI
jgi:uncharacterized membrane protein YhaH (DUF805 family)